MNRPNKTTRLGVAGTALAGAVLAGTSGSAVASSSFDIGSVGSANPRAGVQDNVLTPGLSQTSVAWGTLPLANPDATSGVTHYGYDHLTWRPADPGSQGGVQDRARQERLPRPRWAPLPVPGPRGRSAGVRDPGRPRRERPRQARHAAGRHRHRGRPAARPSTASPGTRSPSSCCSRRRRSTRRAACGASTSTGRATPARAGQCACRRWALAVTRASRPTPQATCGSSRTSAAPASGAARSRTATSTGSAHPTRAT